MYKNYRKGQFYFRSRYLFLGLLGFSLLSPVASANEDGFFQSERRRGQFPQQEGRLILPMPYSLPGLGSGLMIVGALANIGDSHTDTYVVGLLGDVEGYVLGLEDIHLVDETVIIDLQGNDISKATVQQYSTRGMDSSKDDYQYLEVSDVEFFNPQIRFLFNQRRVEFSIGSSYQRVNLDRILDKDSNPLQDIDLTEPHRSYFWGVALDFTDDMYDPRKGVSFTLTNSLSPRQSDDAPDFSVWDISMSLYFPMGKQSTLGFNYRNSRAIVDSPGETDAAILAGPNHYNCNLADASCQSLVSNAQAANRNGTAASLGGDSLLRAYPMDRFKGAAMAYFSSEFRWNITEESTPFNYWIWKDVRTSIQVAFFYELGTVAESQSGLWDLSRDTLGVGLRMVSASGYTYRLDLAVGDEGSATSIMFNYPW
ncbi:MAG: hypothetical protein OEZ15_03140 [Gammaproteobacteria bacterium]|nr:hypothetical protein [Gammaproteobacteria bacterium]